MEYYKFVFEAALCALVGVGTLYLTGLFCFWGWEYFTDK